MMDAMHVRRHDDPTQDAVQPLRQPTFRMIEHRGRVERDLEDQDGDRRRAEAGDDGELEAHREKNFNRMEPRTRRHVEVKIGVVHAVQPPKRRHRVEHHMLQIDREIEHQDRDGDPGPQPGSTTLLSRPHPRCSPSTATPTAATGMVRRSTMVLRATRPRLLGQRTQREIARPRRGATSKTAIR